MEIRTARHFNYTYTGDNEREMASGGIAGYAYGDDYGAATIENCHVKDFKKISATHDEYSIVKSLNVIPVGGIVGHANGANIYGCTVMGATTQANFNSRAYGFIHAIGTIDDMSEEGFIRIGAGGIVGLISLSGKVMACCAARIREIKSAGDVEAPNAAGGLIGTHSDQEVSNEDYEKASYSRSNGGSTIIVGNYCDNKGCIFISDYEVAGVFLGYMKEDIFIYSNFYNGDESGIGSGDYIEEAVINIDSEDWLYNEMTVLQRMNSALSDAFLSDEDSNYTWGWEQNGAYKAGNYNGPGPYYFPYIPKKLSIKTVFPH